MSVVGKGSVTVTTELYNVLIHACSWFSHVSIDHLTMVWNSTRLTPVRSQNPLMGQQYSCSGKTTLPKKTDTNEQNSTVQYNTWEDELFFQH
jgi:hypothetical protein